MDGLETTLTDGDELGGGREREGRERAKGGLSKGIGVLSVSADSIQGCGCRADD